MDCICCKKYKDAENINRILTEEREQSEKFSENGNCSCVQEKIASRGRKTTSFSQFIDYNQQHNTKCKQLELRKPAGFDRKYMSFYTILPALTGLTDTFNAGKVRPKTFVETFLKIHPFADGNGRTCKVLFM